MTTPTWLAVLQAVAYCAAALSALTASIAYFRNSSQERARWIFELYQKFYSSDSHIQMRERIELGNTRFADDEKDAALLRQLDDYLNFFEFVVFLVKHSRLKKAEALDMFQYPLSKIVNDNSLMRYVTRPEYGYEGLTEFLKDLSYP